MAPGQRRLLHLSERTNARSPPPRQLLREVEGAVLGSGQADGRDLTADGVGGFDELGHVGDGFDVNKSMQARDLKARITLVNDRPGSGIATVPNAGLGRMRGSQIV